MLTINDVCVGMVLQGFGLHNAGRFYTVEKVGPKRAYLRRHIDGAGFWTGRLDSYRVTE